MAIQLRLLGTSGCHLCDVARNCVLLGFNDFQGQFLLLDLDIAEHDEMLACFATRIPVLQCLAKNAELAWPFSQAELNDFLMCCSNCDGI